PPARPERLLSLQRPHGAAPAPDARGPAAPARRDAGVDDRYAARRSSPVAREPEGGRRGDAARPGARALRGGARRLASARPVRRGARATRVARGRAPRRSEERRVGKEGRARWEA